MTGLEQPAPHPARAPLWRQLWPLAVIAAALGVVVANGWHRYLSLDTLQSQREFLASFVSEHFLIALASYVAVYMTATVLMVPGALWITISGGFLFGLATGSLATVAGATMGASILFQAARTSIGAALRERAGPFLQKMEAGFREDALSYMFALRFLPVVPFPVANVAPALLGARFGQYVLTTAVGVIPGVLAYTWLGAGLGKAFDAGQTPDLAGIAVNLAPALAALGAVSLIPVLWKRIARKSASPVLPSEGED